MEPQEPRKTPLIQEFIGTPIGESFALDFVRALFCVVLIIIIRADWLIMTDDQFEWPAAIFAFLSRGGYIIVIKVFLLWIVLSLAARIFGDRLNRFFGGKDDIEM